MTSFDAYVLVHPEAFPSNDWDVNDEQYGAAVRTTMSQTKTHIAVLDEYGMEDHENGDDLTVGVTGDGWKVVKADPGELSGVEALLKPLLSGAHTVTVGGFARHDCVPQVMKALKDAGYEVSMDDSTTLPFGTSHTGSLHSPLHTASATEEFVNMLADMVKSTGQGRLKHGDKYDSFNDLIAREGKAYPKVATEAQFKKAGYPRGDLGMCFMNAMNLALDHPDLTYVEGYANGIIPMNHGWCIDKNGTVFDPTWDNGKDYFGVAVPTSWLRGHILRSEIWGLFAGSPGKGEANYKLLKDGIPKTGVKISSKVTYFHASPTRLDVGSILEPADVSRFARQTSDQVYFSTDPWVAVLHVGGVTKVFDGKAFLYEVDPIGSVSDDPEAVATGKTGQSFMASSARVLRRYESTEALDLLDKTGSVHSAGANGGLPEGLTFRYRPGAIEGAGAVTAWVARPADYPYPPRGSETTDDLCLGELSWMSRGVITWVNVYEDEYQRRGVAAAMLEFARTKRPGIRHSDSLNENSKPWAAHTGAVTMTLFHGTNAKNVATIKHDGLKPPVGTDTKWFMLTDSYGQAARYASSNLAEAVVLEFAVPKELVYGTSEFRDAEVKPKFVVWQGWDHTAYDFPGTKAYAVNGVLPAQYLVKVHTKGDHVAGWFTKKPAPVLLVDPLEGRATCPSGHRTTTPMGDGSGLSKCFTCDGLFYPTDDEGFALTAAAKDLPDGYVMEVVKEEKTQWGLPALHIRVRYKGKAKAIAGLGVFQRLDPQTGIILANPNISVDPEHQRKGIAMAMYAEVHRLWPGIPVEHSPHRSEDAHALDRALRQEFGPDMHLGKTAAGGKFIRGFPGRLTTTEGTKFLGMLNDHDLYGAGSMLARLFEQGRDTGMGWTDGGLGQWWAPLDQGFQVTDFGGMGTLRKTKEGDFGGAFYQGLDLGMLWVGTPQAEATRQGTHFDKGTEFVLDEVRVFVRNQPPPGKTFTSEGTWLTLPLHGLISEAAVEGMTFRWVRKDLVYAYFGKEDAGDSPVGEITIGVIDPNTLYVSSIVVEYKRMGIAQGLLEEVHRIHPTKMIEHAGFHDTQGLRWGQEMSKRYPDWNRFAPTKYDKIEFHLAANWLRGFGGDGKGSYDYNKPYVGIGFDGPMGGIMGPGPKNMVYVPWEGDLAKCIKEAERLAQNFYGSDSSYQRWLKTSKNGYVLVVGSQQEGRIIGVGKTLGQWGPPVKVGSDYKEPWPGFMDKIRRDPKGAWTEFCQVIGDAQPPGYDSHPALGKQPENKVTIYRGIILSEGDNPATSTGEKRGKPGMGSSWTLDYDAARAIAERGGAGFSGDNSRAGQRTKVRANGGGDKAEMPVIIRAQVDLNAPGVALYTDGRMYYASEQEVNVDSGTTIKVTGYAVAKAVPESASAAATALAAAKVNQYSDEAYYWITYQWGSFTGGGMRQAVLQESLSMRYTGGMDKPTYLRGQIIEYRRPGSNQTGRITLREDTTVKPSGSITLYGWRTRKDGVMLGDGNFSTYVPLSATKVYPTHDELASQREEAYQKEISGSKTAASFGVPERWVITSAAPGKGRGIPGTGAPGRSTLHRASCPVVARVDPEAIEDLGMMTALQAFHHTSGFDGEHKACVKEFSDEAWTDWAVKRSNMPARPTQEEQYPEVDWSAK